MTKMKTCRECSSELPYDDFPKFTHKNGRQYALARCKPCNDARRQTSEARRKTSLKTKYGITLKEYDSMYESQRGVCKICLQPESNPRVKFLSVDHCHSTGKVRGLLCTRCNTGLGKFLDNVEYLTNAINYLNETSI